MTGYGRGNAHSSSDRVTAEVKVLNSRYLDLKLRGIELPPALEIKVRNRIRNELVRGSIIVTLALEDETGKTIPPVFNKERFEAVDKIITAIQREYGRHLDLTNILSSSDLFIDAESSELSDRVLLRALDNALKQVKSMRSKEGQSLQLDLDRRLEILKKWITEIETISSDSTQNRKTQLETRLQDLVGNLKLDENRIYQEIAILADKYDIAEEITRCHSHFQQFKLLFDIDEPVGKRLNFLLQEISREVNTIGSKSNQPAVTKLVIEMKDQLEKMREQVQNIL